MARDRCFERASAQGQGPAAEHWRGLFPLLLPLGKRSFGELLYALAADCQQAM